jgi:hypothetical protein
MRPRILLVPEFTEVQWTIKPLLESWADVRSFDPPGVGDEPRLDDLAQLTRQVIVDRALEELDRAAWDHCFVAADGWAIPVAVRIATERPELVLGVALGHACLSNRRTGERAPFNADVYAAMEQLVETDAAGFIRYGIVQGTAGSISEETAEQMLSRFRPDDIRVGWTLLTAEDDFGDELRSLKQPMLLAKHDGCLMSNDEGFEDAVAALPDAEIVVVPDAPSTSEEFAEALRKFCLSSSDPRRSPGPATPRDPR